MPDRPPANGWLPVLSDCQPGLYPHSTLRDDGAVIGASRWQRCMK